VSRYRYYVLAVLCSLSFLTYLDRICIMRVQGDIERDLEWMGQDGLVRNSATPTRGMEWQVDLRS